MSPFEEQVLDYIDDIENTLSTTDTRINDISVRLEQIENKIISGDQLIAEKQEIGNTNMIMITMCLMLTLLFTFIMRCFK